MGTRAQVLIEDTKVYLYQHWSGNRLLDTVVESMKKCSDRWDDPEYLTRIIFCDMVRYDLDGHTGYGIGNSQHGDIEYLVKVDCKKKTVKLYTSGNDFKRCWTTIPFKDLLEEVNHGSA